MHCQLRWTVASVMVLDSKSIADAMVCACRKLLRDLSRVKPPILYSVIGAYSLAPARVTSNACLRVQGLRLAVCVRCPSYDES